MLLFCIFFLIYLALLPTDVVLLLSCQSPAMSGISLHQVYVHNLTKHLEAAAREANREYNSSLSDWPELLPTYWRFGISGICDVFETTGEVYCRRRFCPNHDIMTVVQDSLSHTLARLSSSERQTIDNGTVPISRETELSILSSWRNALESIPPDQRPKKVANTLVIIIAVCTIVNAVTDIWPFLNRWAFFAFGLSFVASLTAFVCINVLPSKTIIRIAETTESGFSLLFLGVLVRLGFFIVGAGGWFLSCKERRNAGVNAPPASRNPDRPGEIGLATGVAEAASTANQSEVVGTIDAPPGHAPRGDR